MTTLQVQLLIASLIVYLMSAVSCCALAAPIELAADEVEFDTKKGKSIYRGNVVIVQGNLRLTGDVVEVFTEDGEIVRIFARAKPTTFSNQAKNEEESLYAEAHTIEYDVKAQRIQLRGRARVNSAQRSLRSHAIVYLLATGEMFADGGDKGRVRLIVNPDKP